MEHTTYTEFKQALRHHTEGDLFFDPIHLIAYSVDASIYEIEPIGVFQPKSIGDLIHAVKVAHKFKIPVIARGAATGITGGCIGKGLIIDTSRYLNKILEINIEQEYAVCEPGVIQDHLNAALSPYGYRLGPDTSTGNRATLGGMMANNAAGARSLRYGEMVDHVEAVDLILSNGDLFTFGPIDTANLELKCSLNNREGQIYKEILRIQKTYRQEIELRFPNIPRRASGYNLNELIKPAPLNLAKIITGSEGTLGIAAKIKVKISKKPKYLGLSVIHFETIHQGMSFTEKMLKHLPLALEMIDHHIIEMGRLSPAMKGKLEWLHGSPQMILVAEFDGENLMDVETRLSVFKESMKAENAGYSIINIIDPSEMQNVWDLRKAGLGLLLSKRTYSRAIAFIEDLSVAPDQLASFMDKFQVYLKKIGKEAGIYGHIGPGCLHIRPYINLLHKDETAVLKKIMEDVSDLILEHKGSLSGEHGDGIIRTWLNPKMFGENIYHAFIELKEAFDPENLMNPGKIVNGQPVLENLRINPDTKIASIQTYMDFSREGGFELSVDLCNGNGLCRKSEGIMCPSFQVSGNEYDTTRARAQALRAIINSRLPMEDFTDPKLYDVLDLCIECKGCKSECPSQVDMAKMKAEFLYHYQNKHGIPLRSHLFGNIDRINQLGSFFPSIFNYMAKSPLSKFILSKIGISSRRQIPLLAAQKFSDWFNTCRQKEGKRGKVVLFNDTYNEFNTPEIGKAAVKILNSLDYEVVVPPWKCCGRPLLSKGLLPKAHDHARQVINMLSGYAKSGIKIIGLEPSCILTIKDDFQDLVKDEKENIYAIMKAVQTLDEFLEEHLENGVLPIPLTKAYREIKFHGHCHQKSLIGTKPSLNVLKSIPEANVEEIQSGCCGMAGSFGYEKEHEEFSMKIGSLHLFPAINQSPESAIIVSNGTSCRSQIADGTRRKALHLAEVIALHLDKTSII